VRLTRLRLNGFKSFVDPTDLVIHEGLTGVVGPNGCGKSNLLEALRWVMGENRPLQCAAGDGGCDLQRGCHAGARHFAEVAITIDNSGPAGAIRVQRSGPDRDRRGGSRAMRGRPTSCNSKDVRARDVQMLFADASTGSHSPALVRQGQISQN
jgi:chromosome segregation protein